MLKYLRLTPAFQRWNDSVPSAQRDDWHSYQAYVARADQTLCIVDLLWAEFVDREGLILRKNNLPEDWERFMREAKEANWSASDIEYTINHLHIADVFMNDPDRDQIDNRVYTFLASTIVEAWRCKLRDQYPQLQFAVGVADEQIDPEVYMYVIRNT